MVNPYRGEYWALIGLVDVHYPPSSQWGEQAMSEGMFYLEYSREWKPGCHCTFLIGVRDLEEVCICCLQMGIV
jgi:hypothetical protein